jgi:hypothetical protein
MTGPVIPASRSFAPVSRIASIPETAKAAKPEKTLAKSFRKKFREKIRA